MLYSRGAAQFVLNREQDSAAFEHFLLHGASVCAIGLRVTDVPDAMRRAEALHCPAWRGPIGAGERRIPAVRAPDGMLIHMVQPDPAGRTIWEDDFELHGQAPDDGMEIDHVAEAFPVSRLDSAVLFWRAVFGFAVAPLVEIADPFGLVQSRAMISPNGRVRLPLNVSESRQTATGPLPVRHRRRRRAARGALHHDGCRHRASGGGQPAAAHAGQLLRGPRRPLGPR